MNPNYLDFEQPIAELQAKIDELRNVGSDNALNLDEEIQRLQAKMRQKLASIFKELTPWQVSQISRHPLRPYTLDYIDHLFDEFHELHGDRAFADDHAIVGGLARFRGRAVMTIGQQKGRDTKAKIFRNFGMPRPEGYRKALRLMKMAERFSLPILTFIDTPGAYPGVGAEERGQSEAIATNLQYMARSIYFPDEYIVEGFNPGMPVINKPPIGLTDDEIVAVLAYLQSLGGTPDLTLEVTAEELGIE